jgi:hypothetical protein
MVAFRAYFSNLFRRSTNRRESMVVGPMQAPPPMPWKFAFLCIAASVALLFVPDLRQALSVTYASWRGGFARYDESPTWERIARDAEKSGDAAGMAFAAVRLADAEGKHFDEALRLAQRAVAKDPSLTWTYYFLDRREQDTRFHGKRHTELLERLRAWDAGNAVAYLATAEEAARAYKHDPNSHKADDSALTPDEDRSLKEPFRSEIRGFGPQWREWMDRGFAAPVYDDYLGRWLDLSRQVTRQYAVGDPIAALFGYWAMQVLDVNEMRVYVELRLARGDEAQRAGRLEDATSQYWSVAQFGQRMRLSTQRPMSEGYIQDLIANEVQQEAFQHLQPLLRQMGRSQEAEVVAAEAENAIKERSAYRWESQRTDAFLSSSALLVQFWTGLLALSVLLVAAALAAIAVRRSHLKFARFWLAYGSPMLAISCLGLLGAYRPYARAYAAFLEGPSDGGIGPLHDFYSLFGAQMQLTSLFSGDERLLWWAVIAAGTATCIWLTSRALWRRVA